MKHSRSVGGSALRPAGSTREWRRLRAAVLLRDAWQCRVPLDAEGRIALDGRPCGLPADTVDHIVPRTHGGNDAPDNLRAACRRHNFAKGSALDGDASSPGRGRGTDKPGEGVRAWTW